MIKITLLCENTVKQMGLIGEHGLAYWIDTGEHRILFDTGQGYGIVSNAKALDIDLSSTDIVVLSHGHTDHVGGLQDALRHCPRASLVLHPDASLRRYSRKPNGQPKKLSTDFMESRGFACNRSIEYITKPHLLAPGIWATGQIPRINDFEDVGGPFFWDESLSLPDPILDDMALWIQSNDSLSIIFGCAHAGVVNTIRYIKEFSRVNQVDLIAGGLHLLNAKPFRMDKTIEHLKSIQPRRMGFCHCTGSAAIRRLWSEFPDNCFDFHVGDSIHVD